MLYLVLALVAVVSAKPSHIDNPLSKESIDQINNVEGITWTAGENFGEGWTIQDIKAMCGVLPSKHILQGMFIKTLNGNIKEHFIVTLD